MFIISFILLTQLSFATTTYKCPQNPPNPRLGEGQTIQGNDQVRCKKASGFAEQRCDTGLVSGTYYNVPIESMRSTWDAYPLFFNCLDQKSSVKHFLDTDKKLKLVCRPHGNKVFEPPGCCRPTPSDGAVNVNGSGITAEAKVVHYTGDLQKNPCKPILGLSTVKSGSSHKCLIPFLSIACDTETYALGTIIQVPMLKDQIITLSENPKRTIKHPGYFICEDTGSAIQGPGRVDFFTGPFGNHEFNLFSPKGGKPAFELNMKNCNKAYSVIRQDNANWPQAFNKIKEAIQLKNSKSDSIWFSTPGVR